MTNHARLHHLVAHSLLKPEPIGCAATYEEADTFRREFLGGIGVISLHCNMDCPICADGDHGKVRVFGRGPTP